MSKIESVILYCSYDERFINRCIKNLLECGIESNVVSCSNLYRGALEKDVHIQSPCKHKVVAWKPGMSSMYWESYCRRVGIRMVSRDCEYILFIDADEIVEPILFKEWLSTKKYERYTGIKLAQYVYSIDPRYRLNVKVYGTVMCRTAYAKTVKKTEARLQFINNDNRLSRWMMKLGLSRKFYIERTQMIHHYTGVHTKEQMHTKVENWSHNSDRPDWHDVIDSEWKVNGNKIGNHTFTIVENIFNL